MGGWAVSNFFFFKSLDNNMVYSLGIYVFVYKRNPCRSKVLWVLKFGEAGDRTNENQNLPMYDGFWFFVQNFIFLGLGTFLVIFLSYKVKIYKKNKTKKASTTKMVTKKKREKRRERIV